MDPLECSIAMTYFLFTTLSTVGFGDYYPVGNIERSVMIPIFLFGVMIFSYIMGNFAEILQVIMEIDSDLEEGEQLEKFFGTLKYFNKNHDLDPEFRERIAEYFFFRWDNYKNWALETDEDLLIFTQLPSHTRLSIYKDSLYKNFMRYFIKFFTFPNHMAPQ